MSEISIEQVNWEWVQGLEPRAYCLVGKGFIREELKSECFSRDITLGPDSIQSLVDLAGSLLPTKKTVVTSLGRIALLEEYLRNRSFRERFPELCVSRDRSRYATRLDRELQRGRGLYVRSLEAVLHHELLNTALGPDARRTEYFILAGLLESRLQELDVRDEIMILREAVAGLEEGTLNSALLPEKIFWFHAGETTPLEDAFLEHLKRSCDFISVKRSNAEPMTFNRRQCHTIEDAISFALDQVSTESAVLVIEDKPEVRRAVRRALRSRDLIPADPRNPMALLESESLKQSLGKAEGFPTGRVTLREVAAWVAAQVELSPMHSAVRLWENETDAVGLADRRLPSAYWIRGLRESVRTLKPPPDRLRPESSLLVLRYDQVPALRITSESTIHLLGVSESWFENVSSSWQWYSDAECSVLLKDYPVFDSKQAEKLQKEFVLSWLKVGANVVAWEPKIGLDGKELSELSLEWKRLLDSIEVPTPQNFGAHPFWKAALVKLPQSKERGITRPVVDLLDLTSPQAISLLDDYTKCPFLAYASRILKLRDLADEDPEIAGNLWGDVLHHAIFLMTAKDQTPEAALDTAWELAVSEKAVVAPRMERAARARALILLKEFLIDESAYRKSSQATPESFEADLEISLGQMQFRGRADRVDRHPDGYIVLDYKTSKTGAPGGLELFSKGIGAQLAIYALAVKERTKAEVVGALYVLLNAPFTRKKGFIFKAHPILKLGGGINFSRVNEEPDVVWGRARGLLEANVNRMTEGWFGAVPASEKNCVHCRMRLSCGEGRRSLDSEEGDAPD